MQSKWLAIFVSLFILSLQGCETVKGASKGLKQDAKNTWGHLNNDNNWLKKTDAWIKENVW